MTKLRKFTKGLSESSVEESNFSKNILSSIEDISNELDDLKKVISQSVVNTPDYMVILKPSEKTQLQSIFTLLESLHKDEIKNISIGVKKNETQK